MTQSCPNDQRSFSGAAPRVDPLRGARVPELPLVFAVPPAESVSANFFD
jgi:hypothetical protein